jgi:hypothetical protein
MPMPGRLFPGLHHHTSMSTRSIITAKTSGGIFKTIYCHFDGYPSGVGATLLKHYTDQAKIDALMALGDLSSLDAECIAPEGHSHGMPVKGCSVAYGRDRGETDVDATEGATAKEARDAKGDLGQEYSYLWDGEAWTVNCLDGSDPLPVAEAIKNEG